MVRQELSQLVRLALPIILTQLSQMGMGVADTVMAGRLSAADLAGVALGGNLFWPAMLFITGLIMSITPSVSQLHGRGQGERAGEVVRQALWIALVGGGALIVLLRNAEPILRAIEVDPLAIPIAGAYLRALSWGVLPMLGFFAMRYLCDSMSWTLPAMVVALSGLALKVPLNALFIYGGLGMPGLGGAGCGYASAIVMTGQMLAMAGIVAFSRMRSAGLFNRFSWPDFREIGRLFRLGAPIGASHFLEISMFSAVTLLIGRLGVDVVAAQSNRWQCGLASPSWCRWPWAWRRPCGWASTWAAEDWSCGPSQRQRRAGRQHRLWLGRSGGHIPLPGSCAELSTPRIQPYSP